MRTRLPVPLPSRAPRGYSVVGLLVFVAAVAALAIFPQFVKKPYVLHMGVLLFLAVIQGQAWNVVGGYAGQYSVGHAAYFGVGAYVTMMLLEVNKIAPWWGVWAAMAASVLLSLVIGSITFRLRGPYFVLASISVAEIIRLATLYFKDLTRGAEGFLLGEIPTMNLLGNEILFIGKRPFYFVGLGLAVVAVAVNWVVQHSKLGYYFQAIREDQDAAHSLGINLSFYKNVALSISAALTALAGGFYAMFVKFIDPNTVFGLDVSVQIVLLCIIGGIGTIIGPVIGAVVLVPLSEILRNPKGLVQVGVLPPDSGFVTFVERYLSNAHLLVYGILVVLVILFAPEGVLGVIRRAATRWGRRPQDVPPAAAKA
ncbi:branched-chain amino acid ABC transporter permease [Anaeromyxobacter dehalogenans]|uniref:Amino acid/amide ABC transporter membrane protein 2, HAAT family n=1 Tax=Anaeromyxobacter dehalogenans (strain 2CP-C) TaxID=290397 RepID=Q2IKL4_ANADE|nr:branched-chain amino acid ABC transporter permease [Anaeromyxobacter dehalogenans]ABC82196.1 amino acid/amide ABC transporter membrane protein 2, HAAT family [Anaeromyxobacter dehalogenans 2CP-C]